MADIWYNKPDIKVINEHIDTGTICEYLNIQVTEIGDDYIRGTMPADRRTFQPYGVVHGGANVVLAETLGSIAGNCVVNYEKYRCFGQEVSATHIRPVSSGRVNCTARPIHLGKRSHVWEMRLEDDRSKLTCLCKLILAIVPIDGDNSTN
jgi:1,4-dihydroxy-2-naphthoyl-CoA hydrolase